MVEHRPHSRYWYKGLTNEKFINGGKDHYCFSDLLHLSNDISDDIRLIPEIIKTGNVSAIYPPTSIEEIIFKAGTCFSSV